MEEDKQEVVKGEKKSPSVYSVIGPISGGMILDIADLATFGPIGLYAGIIAGGVITYYITSFYKLENRTRLIVILLGGIYCTLPMTEAIPAATLISAVIKLLEREER